MSQKTEILVLDDEPIVGERLSDFLEKKGMAVETFTESQKALDRLAEKTFDVIVTDLKMEGPSGIDVLTQIKRSSARSEVIIITGYGSFETLRGAEIVGAFDYINKPFKMEELYSRVVKAAKKAKKHKS